MNEKDVIYEYRDYLKQCYGEVLHRVPLDVGFNCPHRSKGNRKGGCIFCPEDGARAVQLGYHNDIREQIRAGVAFAKKRYNARAFMAYLQTFTNTNAAVEDLDALVRTILAEQKFKAIAFGTRPDCLPGETISYLTELQSELDVWVELGVQTIHDATLERINRGHDWAASRKAIFQLHEAGIRVAVHLIFGLPGEDIVAFRQTLKALANFPIDAVKFHNLHVIRGTALERSYAASPFPLFDEHQYVELLLQLLPLVPTKRPIIRLTTDTPDELLVAPRWSMSKGQFRNYLFGRMRKQGVRQGMALGTNDSLGFPEKDRAALSPPVTTADGSITFWNAECKEHYHSRSGARLEAEQKYCHPGGLGRRLAKGPVRILDICFGLGYNSLAACERAMKTGGALEIIGLEVDRRVVAAAADSIVEAEVSFNWNGCLRQLCDEGYWHEGDCSIRLVWGDARHTVRHLRGSFDLIWLDAFSTQRNAELWTLDFFNNLVPLMAKDGALLTYCAAIPVRAALLNVGFHVGETEPVGRERGGTIASLNPDRIQLSLPERDHFLIQTVRGIPYRDPDGTRTNREILRAREEEIIRFKVANQSATTTDSTP